MIDSVDINIIENSDEDMLNPEKPIEVSSMDSKGGDLFNVELHLQQGKTTLEKLMFETVGEKGEEQIVEIELKPGSRAESLFFKDLGGELGGGLQKSMSIEQMITFANKLSGGIWI